MINRLFDLVIKATNQAPLYTPGHCLEVTRSVGGCDICEKTCPHEAITIRRKVEIDDIDCTGCGLCVQACPSQALESRVRYQAGAPLRCSQVAGDAQSVHCLARLRSSDLLRLAGTEGKVTLARGACENCPVGSEAVIETTERIIEDAKTLAEFRDKPIEVELMVGEELNAGDRPVQLSRRELFFGSWRNVQHSAAELLAPLDPGGDEANERPTEMQKRYLLIESANPEPETPVPWILPRIAEGCIMCPVCTNVCPTDAFQREFEKPSEGRGASLKLEPEKCMGCGACVSSCPVKVISLDDQISWQELSGGIQEVYRKDAGQGMAGAKARFSRDS